MEKIEAVEKLAGQLLNQVGFEITPTVSFDGGTYTVALPAGDHSALLIGYHGETLNSLQTLLGLLVYRKLNEVLPLVVDIDNYRKERIEKLKSLTVRTCDKARFLNLPQNLPPMSAFERRLVHLFVSEIPDMKSESTGEGRDRQVVISPKSLENQPSGESAG